MATLLLLAISFSSVYAIQIPQNGSISIDTPVDHDLFLTGQTITINARVEGDVLAAGGTVIINAPVSGDLLAIAGEVTINAPIGGTVTVVGGQVRIRADVGGRILAVGGTVGVGSKAPKLVALGGTVGISVATVIDKYAFVVGGTVENNGAVRGELRVITNDFHNTGSAGKIVQERIEPQVPTWLSAVFRDITGPYASMQVTLNVLISLGYLVLGLVLLMLFPRQFLVVHGEMVKSPVRNTVAGFLLIIGTGIASVLFALTVIGLPLAAILVMLLVTSSMISGLVVSLALGKRVAGAINFKARDIWSLVLGFLILSILSSFALIGWVVYVVAVSLGLGAIFYTLRENWPSLRATP